MKKKKENLTKQGGDFAQPIVMRSLPAEDVVSVLRMLSEHAYGKEQYDECVNDLTKIDDAFAFDHAVMIILLGGELEGNDA